MEQDRLMADPEGSQEPTEEDATDLDISLGQTRGRERARRTPPDRLSGTSVSAVGAVRAGGLRVYVAHDVCAAVERHAGSDTTRELGGVLLGDFYEGPDGPFLQIEDAIPAAGADSHAARITFTHETWAHFTRECDRRDDNLRIIGWYHTHPGFGIFLSGHDLFIHRNFFTEPWQVALVVDPLAGERGFFHWRDGHVTPADGWYLYAPEEEAEALMRLTGRLRVSRERARREPISAGDTQMAELFGRRLENVRSYVLLVAVVGFLVLGLNLILLLNVTRLSGDVREVSRLAERNSPLGRGRDLIAVKRYEEAIDELQLAALQPDWRAEASYHLYRAYTRLDRHDEARGAIALAAEAAPERYRSEHACAIGDDLRRGTPFTPATARADQRLRLDGFKCALDEADTAAIRIAASALDNRDTQVLLRGLLDAGDTDVVVTAVRFLRPRREAAAQEVLAVFARRMHTRAADRYALGAPASAAGLIALAHEATPGDGAIEDDYWLYRHAVGLADLDEVLEHGRRYKRFAEVVMARGEAEDRERLLEALGARDGDWVREVLRTAIADADEDVREAALHSLSALGVRGDWRAVQIVGRALWATDDPAFRRACIEALGASKQQVALAPLQKAVLATNLSERTRERAVEALAELGAGGQPVLAGCVLPDGNEAVADAIEDAKPAAKANALYDRAWREYHAGKVAEAWTSINAVDDRVTGRRSRQHLRGLIERAMKQRPTTAPA